MIRKVVKYFTTRTTTKTSKPTKPTKPTKPIEPPSIDSQKKQIDQKVKSLSQTYRKLLQGKPTIEQKLKLTEIVDQINELERRKIGLVKQVNAEKELETVKEYVMKLIPEKEEKKQEERYIPNNLTMHKLFRKNHELLLIGVDKANLEHSLFVRDLLERLEIQTCMTQIPPDSPYLIKTQKQVRVAWRNFVRGRDYSFYLSNQPKYIQQAMLDKPKISAFKSNLFQSQQFSAQLTYGLQYDPTTKRFQPNSFLCPLFCPQVNKIIFCDYPMLKQREYQANSMDLKSLRQLFKDYIDRLNNSGNNRSYDPRLLHYDKMLKHKIDHITGILKLGCLFEEKTIAVVDRQYTEFIAEAWKKEIGDRMFDYEAVETGGPFVEFIEKLVILDLMLEPLIDKFFIKNYRFPYSVKNKVGGPELVNSLFLIWYFYYKKYHQAKDPDSYNAVQENKPHSDALNDPYSPFDKV